MSSTKIGDEFLRVPKLDVAGANWVIYKDRFLWSIDARGYLDHIDGSETEPVNPVNRTASVPLTPEEEAEVAEWKKSLKAWKQGEAIVKQQIAGSRGSRVEEVTESLETRRSYCQATNRWNDSGLTVHEDPWAWYCQGDLGSPVKRLPE
jgi:hypothetical protein